MKTRGKACTLPVDKLNPNPWNPHVMSERMMGKLTNSIKDRGFIKRVIVRELGKAYEIIDGHHRVEVAQKLGIDKIPCTNLGKVSDAEAKILCEIFIHLHGDADLVKEASLIKSLIDVDAVDIVELTASLPMEEDQIKSLYGALDFDWGQFGEPPTGPEIPDPPEPPEGPTDPIPPSTPGTNDTPSQGMTREQKEVIDKAVSLAGGSYYEGLATIAEFYIARYHETE